MQIKEQNQLIIHPNEELWTPEQVAEFLQVAPTTVRHWGYYHDMGPKPVKAGSQVRYFKSDVIEWLKASYYDTEHLVRSPDDRPLKAHIHDKMLQFEIGINQLCELIEDNDSFPPDKAIKRFQKYDFSQHFMDKLCESNEEEPSILEQALTLAGERVLEDTDEYVDTYGRSPRKNHDYYKRFKAKQRQKEKTNAANTDPKNN